MQRPPRKNAETQANHKENISTLNAQAANGGDGRLDVQMFSALKEISRPAS